MNYSTALKLKEAGFPQSTTEDANHYSHLDENNNPCPSYITGAVYIPTLEELIEALELKKSTKFHLLWKTRGAVWQASIFDTRRNHVYRESPTPIEAVANLYLALHSK